MAASPSPPNAEQRQQHGAEDAKEGAILASASSTQQHASISCEKVSGLAALIGHYDVFIFDQFGVLHNGVNALPGAVEAVRRLKCEGKKLYIMSNWSALKTAGIAKLGKIGFEGSVFDDFICSGELCRRHILKHVVGGGALSSKDGEGIEDKSARALWISYEPQRREELGAKDYIAGIPLADSVESATFILCQFAHSIFAGTAAEWHLEKFQNGGDLSELEELLAKCLARNLPLLCANPDKFVVSPDGGRRYMQGLLAERYEEMGGQVTWFGKPSRITYLEGVPEILESDDKRKRVLMIGDAMETDVQGAANAGIDALMVVNTGIHYGTDLGEDWTPTDVEKLGRDKFTGLCPRWCAAECCW